MQAPATEVFELLMLCSALLIRLRTIALPTALETCACHVRMPPGSACRYEVLESMAPWMGGGEMIQDVFLDHSTYADPPSRSPRLP